MTSKSRRPPSEFTRSRRPRNSLLFLVATAVAAPLLAQAPAGGYPPNVHVVRRQSQHREIWPRRSVANTAGETPLTQINALVRQVAAYSPRELNPATRRVLLGSFITARRAYKSGKRCRAMKLLDTIPSILSADIQ